MPHAKNNNRKYRRKPVESTPKPKPVQQNKIREPHYAKDTHEAIPDILSQYKRELLIMLSVIVFAVIIVYQLLPEVEVPLQGMAAPVTEKQRKKELNEEQLLAAYRKKKEETIDDSYEEVMYMGALNMDLGTSQEAVSKYYDAKTIYPYRLEPRIALAGAFLERCKEKKGLCRYVAKELRYAQFYVNEETSKKQKNELKRIQAELDKIYILKDSSFLKAF